MGDSPGKFACEGCGKSYAWKPELAGRKVKCKCGAVMRVPESLDGVAADADEFELAAPTAKPPTPIPPGAGDKDDPGASAAAGSGENESYGLSGDSQIGAASPAASSDDACPECGAAMAAEAVLCVQCGYHRHKGEKLGGATVTHDDDGAPAHGAGQSGMLGKLRSLSSRMRKRKE